MMLPADRVCVVCVWSGQVDQKEVAIHIAERRIHSPISSKLRPARNSAVGASLVYQ